MAAKTKSECVDKLKAVKDAVTLISGKWKMPIIISLMYGDKRFTEIQRDIQTITPRMLSQELRDLELNEIVKRTVYDAVPAFVEYSLTSYGKEMEELLDTLVDWGEKHRKKIIRKK